MQKSLGFGLEQVQLATFLGRSASEREQLERIMRAKRAIDDAPQEILSLEDMANAACYAPTHFHKLFKRELGLTPHQYLTRRRLELARELLLTTDMEITDICLSIGFQSLGSFSTLFRKHTGHAPSRYRRRYFKLGWAPSPPRVPWCFMRRANIT
jgi:AraC-like DNA-binding protein